MTIGLALAGGGARGIAHIGVLQVLEERGVELDHIAGTSAGAIIGAMYASRPDGRWVEKRFREFLDSAAFRALGTDRLARQHAAPDETSPFGKRVKDHVTVNLSLMRRFVIPREKLNAAVEFLVPARRFEDLEIPMSICASDLQSGQVIVYDDGDLVHALANSASIPGILEAEVNPKQIIVDGGVLAPVPVDELSRSVDFVIASEISRRGLPPLHEVNIFRLMMRSEQLSQMALAQRQALAADFVFCPDVMSLHWSQFDAFDELYRNGRNEAEERIQSLLDQLRRRASPVTRARQWLSRWLNAEIRIPR